MAGALIPLPLMKVPLVEPRPITYQPPTRQYTEACRSSCSRPIPRPRWELPDPCSSHETSRHEPGAVRLDGRDPAALRLSAHPATDPGSNRWFTGLLNGQPAQAHDRQPPRRSVVGQPPFGTARPFELETHDPSWTRRNPPLAGRTLVDHNGEPAGSIEVIYLDNATGQPEWALLEAAAGRAPTFVPLVGASEEGDCVRMPFDKALVEGAPSCRPTVSFRKTRRGAVPPLRCPLLTGRLPKRPARRRTRDRRGAPTGRRTPGGWRDGFRGASASRGA